MKIYRYTLPLCPADISQLNISDKVLLSGCLFTARDAAHKRMVEIIQRGEKLPLDLAETTLFYCGPSPARPGNVCGAIGPTSSSRMDVYTPILIQNGLRVMIGKGERSLEVQKRLWTLERSILLCLEAFPPIYLNILFPVKHFFGKNWVPKLSINFG